jgi:hypothetical protein
MNTNAFINVMLGNIYRVISYKNFKDMNARRPSKIIMEWVDNNDIKDFLKKIKYKPHGLNAGWVYLQKYSVDTWKTISYDEVN